MDDDGCTLNLAELSANSIAINADTPIPADLAALYLGLDPEKLAYLRSNNDGPTPISQANAPRSLSRNDTFYSLGTLRNWRKTNSPAEAVRSEPPLNAAHRWTGKSEPFWMDDTGRIVEPASPSSLPDWTTQFMRALSAEVRPYWLTPRLALEMRWQIPDMQRQFAEKIIECLVQMRDEVMDACRRSNDGNLEEDGTYLSRTTNMPTVVEEWYDATPLLNGIRELRATSLSAWTQSIEPFWITGSYMIVYPASEPDNSIRDILARLAPAEDLGLIWLSPLQALTMNWRCCSRHQAFAGEFLGTLNKALEDAGRAHARSARASFNGEK